MDIKKVVPNMYVSLRLADLSLVADLLEDGNWAVKLCDHLDDKSTCLEMDQAALAAVVAIAVAGGDAWGYKMEAEAAFNYLYRLAEEAVGHLPMNLRPIP